MNVYWCVLFRTDNQVQYSKQGKIFTKFVGIDSVTHASSD